MDAGREFWEFNRGGWKISGSTTFETVEIDETDHFSRPLACKSKNLILQREDSKFCITGCKWVLKISPTHFPGGEPWEILNDINCELLASFESVEEFQFMSYEPFEKLFRIQKDLRRKVSVTRRILGTEVETEEIIFTIPMLFSVFADSCVLPLIDYNHITFRLKKIPDCVIDATCLVTYARYPHGENVGNMVRDGYYTPFSNFNLYGIRQRTFVCQTMGIYNLRWVSPNVLWNSETICNLNFEPPRLGACYGFCIAFNSDNVAGNIIRKSLLKSVDIRYPSLAIDYEFQNTDVLEDTQVDCSSCQSCVFPIEVWARILHFCEEPGPLMRTCKFLWKCSRQYSIYKEARDRLFRPRGWYFMIFSEKSGHPVRPDRWKPYSLTLEFREQPPLDMRCIVIVLTEKTLIYNAGTYTFNDHPGAPC